tara:strand:- start:3797 stop:5560 length:1764 start_codon:yes stop_codon:yes gene_type:complete
MALPMARNGVGPVNDDLTPEKQASNIWTFNQQMGLIAKHFENNSINGVTFLTNKRPVNPQDVENRVAEYRRHLAEASILVDSLDGIDPMIDRAISEDDKDKKIESMILSLLDALRFIISEHQGRHIVFLIQGTKSLMMVQTFVARLTKNIPNLSFIHLDIPPSGEPCNLRNLSTTLFPSVEASDRQVHYVSPNEENSEFFSINKNDSKMYHLMKDDYVQKIGLGEDTNPTEAEFDSPTRQGVQNTIGKMRELGLLDDESKYTPHGVIVRAAHAGRPIRPPNSDPIGKKGFLIPIGIENYNPDGTDTIEEYIQKKALKFIRQIRNMHDVEFVQPIFIHTHDNATTGIYNISELPNDFDILKSNIDGIYHQIDEEIRMMNTDYVCQVLDPRVMVIGTESIENMAAGLLHILCCLPKESEGSTINWNIFASTWVGVSTVVAADAMITMQIPSISPFREPVGPLIPARTAIPCSKELLVELRRIELLLSLKFNSLSSERGFSCILAATLVHNDSTNPESCLKGRFREGTIEQRFNDVALPNWEGARKKIDGSLKDDLRNFGWIEFQDKGNARLLREGRILGHVLALHTIDG